MPTQQQCSNQLLIRVGQYECALVEALVLTQKRYQAIAPAYLVLLHVFTFFAWCAVRQADASHHQSRASPPLNS
jgi:hypothetical protein